ncbi:hypothetical protein DFA_02687 [Cavenderia fasciculata]|uniref:Transmembrane protein n=1 Tax=Cavenderia fasciculata TaxID=261658 RepID=F4Q033_CACFS|nr:uncharacterized protein DFA_02687 [Cavenderia fasciculata]EGG18947.1 hypothetical protein DFA_02687 [Cavenderia fasciculata]|eukprot:XP_004357409.1 hypothetical protein DFA_02687 [Cavenderia fasciculata]
MFLSLTETTIYSAVDDNIIQIITFHSNNNTETLSRDLNRNSLKYTTLLSCTKKYDIQFSIVLLFEAITMILFGADLLSNATPYNQLFDDDIWSNLVLMITWALLLHHRTVIGVTHGVAYYWSLAADVLYGFKLHYTLILHHPIK